LAGIAVFAGVFGALRIDHYLTERADHSPVQYRQSSAPTVNVELPAGAPTTSTIDFRAAAKRVNPSVVSVDQYRRGRAGWFDDRVVETETGTGSGVILSTSGIIVTNNHVVANASRVTVRLADHKSYNARVLGTDPRSDLAVLKIDAPNLQPIEVGQSKDVEVGQWVLAVGNPLGFDNTVSVGVVSSLKRNLPVGQGGIVDALQTDAAINPGNSGGALCDAAGRLIGINSAIASGTGQSVGIGFAIPVDRVKTIVDQIVTVGHARYAGLGVRYNERLDGVLGDPNAREQLAQEMGTSNLPTNGIIVLQTGGAAAKAGIGKYDIILAIDGEKIDGTFDMNRILVPKKPGDVVSVKFWSNGATKTVRVKLQELEETV
jgi:S1-C subfamily serine protease